MGVTGWGIWISGWFTLTDIQVMAEPQAVLEQVQSHLSGIRGRNTLFLDSDEIAADIARVLPQTKDILVERILPHTLRVSAGVREALGVWCRPLSRNGECFFFDDERIWGSAIPSRGTLMITVMDEHPEGAPYAELVADIRMLSDGIAALDLNVSRVVLPAGPLNEIHIETTEGYPILFSRSTDLQEQLEVLEVFLSERRTNGAFVPEYIDVRVPGKVYFK